MSDIRPPFVMFEMRPVEDRNASIAAGHVVMRDVPFIILVPHGSEGKTRIENSYEDWLRNIKGRGGELRAPGAGPETPSMGAARFPQVWLDKIQAGYEAWRRGEELEVEGTPLRNWPVIGQSQRMNCEAAHIRTIEELAEASDSALELVGMGAIALRQRARDWLKANEGEGGKLVLELDAARVRIGELETEVGELKTRLEEAKAELAKVASKPGD